MPDHVDKLVSDEEMSLYRTFFRNVVGIELVPEKKALLYNRLYHRVRALGMNSMLEYYQMMIRPDYAEERQVAIDLLTTNETRFFRDRQHMAYIANEVLPRVPADRRISIWSAACATGEEAYSLAMICQDKLGEDRWQVMGSDVNHTVLQIAKRGMYPVDRISGIPAQYLKRYCLRGTEEYEDKFLIDQNLRRKVRFMPVNLIDIDAEKHWEFDIIFLCNVLIYFNEEVRKRVVESVLSQLRIGGFMVLGNTESFQGMALPLEPCIPSVYRRTV